MARRHPVAGGRPCHGQPHLLQHGGLLAVLRRATRRAYERNPQGRVLEERLIDTPGAQATTTALTDAKRAQIGASGTSEPTAPVKGS